jgi:hypothetical protein
VHPCLTVLHRSFPHRSADQSPVSSLLLHQMLSRDRENRRLDDGRQLLPSCYQFSQFCVRSSAFCSAI